MHHEIKLFFDLTISVQDLRRDTRKNRLTVHQAFFQDAIKICFLQSIVTSDKDCVQVFQNLLSTF